MLGLSILGQMRDLEEGTRRGAGKEPAPLLQGINHIALATGSMDNTIRFWRDLLGFRLVAMLGQTGYRSYAFQLPNGNTVMFFEWPGVEPLPRKDHHKPVKGPFVFDHISFAVERKEDLYELKDRLEAAGFDVSDVADHGYFASIYSFDPNGLPIEFSTTVPVQTKPIVTDPAPSEIARQGADPVPGVWPVPKRKT